MKISIIGGTGPQGQGLALRLAKAGYEVLIGSRTLEKAQRIAKELNEKLNLDSITGMTNEDVVLATPIVFLTIPYDTVQSTLEPLTEAIKSHTQIFVDITVPMKYEKGKGMIFDTPTKGCMSKQISEMLEPVPVVGAFKTISAHALLEIEKPLSRDTFVYGSKESRKEIMDLIAKVETLRPIDAGPLREGETVERLVPFLININKRYKVTDSGIKIIM